MSEEGGSAEGSGSSCGEEEEDESEECPVTSAWIAEVIASHKGHQQVEVVDMCIRPGCDAADAVLSDIVAVRATYRHQADPADRSAALIVKLLPREPFSRYFVTEAQFDLREIKFYTQVVPELEAFARRQAGSGADAVRLPIPECYHARYVPPEAETEPGPDGESVLVLEDLRARGFGGADFSRGLSLRQAHAALAAVARLHALSLALKVKGDGEGSGPVSLPQRYPFLFQTARATDSYQQLVERGLPQLASFLERRPGLEPVLAALLALRPRTKDIIASLLAPQEPLALITHTDFWCNNLLFRGGNDEGERGGVVGGEPEEEAGGSGGACECAVLDWQMVTYSRPTNDVALLLVSSVGTALRRERTAELLDGYWSALTAAARSLRLDVQRELAYDRQRLQADYRRSQLLALLLCIGSVDVALGDPLTEQRLIDVLHDLHADGVLDAEDL
ncbi:uncharacterized protein LOC124753083 [Schistocerca piceifrons]|uniref:uncharacterized protein LOC124713325 n=1 Tax=Schistocerca piceifrons TaxID=274613 RepID=UPI001F5F24D4|nr:uncharacterized protein LOC124713325 [Schistocerca piceifrons]XP_047104970.1 uncharacterized protein LOC124753083 [Schistocerca piceifrons]XP_049963925.1 uncharacterized protein LOC126484445 [Schistocerca serialis cubense]